MNFLQEIHSCSDTPYMNNQNKNLLNKDFNLKNIRIILIILMKIINVNWLKDNKME